MGGERTVRDSSFSHNSASGTTLSAGGGIATFTEGTTTVWSQPDYAGAPVVEFNGRGAGTAIGLDVNASNSPCEAGGQSLCQLWHATAR